MDESEARYASYLDLAEKLRRKAAAPKASLKELFRRIVFNILAGNTDDHARNHSAFLTEKGIELTPAYDICPQGRSTGEASHGMKISGENNLSQLRLCLESAGQYGLSTVEAESIIQDMIVTILEHYSWVCAEAGMARVDRHFFWGRQFLNPSVFYGAEHLRCLFPDQPGTAFKMDL